MIKVTMTLDSFGMGTKLKDLVTIHIVNDGTGTEARGNYNYSVFGKAHQLLKQGRVEDWPRKSKTAIKLLQRVVNDAYPVDKK